MNGKSKAQDSRHNMILFCLMKKSVIFVHIISEELASSSRYTHGSFSHFILVSAYQSSQRGLSEYHRWTITLWNSLTLCPILLFFIAYITTTLYIAFLLICRLSFCWNVGFMRMGTLSICLLLFSQYQFLVSSRCSNIHWMNE